MKFTMTPAAHKFVRRMIQFSANPAGGFRLFVSPGGCSDMSAEFELPLAARHSSIKPTPKRSPSMATEDTEQIEASTPEPASMPAVPDPVLAPDPVIPPAATAHRPDAITALRAEYAEIAAISAQANRLGVTIDAADAMQKGIRPDALRRSVLDALASRSEANSVIARAKP